jgi:hypothetical protein
MVFYHSWFWKKFKESLDFIKNKVGISEPEVLATTVVYILITTGINSSKIFFVWTVIYYISVFVYTRSFEKTIIYTFLPISIFKMGQQYKFNLIPAEILKLPLYPNGRDVIYNFTPYSALVLTCVSSIIVQLIKYRKSIRWRLPVLFLLCWMLTVVISATKSEFTPTLSLILVFESFGIFYWMLVGVNSMEHHSKDWGTEILKIILSILMIITVFESLLVVVQMVKKNTIGLRIEQVSNINYFGSGADENPLFVRPIGLHSSPNELAYVFMTRLFVIGILWIYLTSKTYLKIPRWWMYLTFFMIFLVISVAQCRSVFLGLGVSGGVMLAVYRKEALKMMVKIKNLGSIPIILLLLMSLTVSITFPDRILNTFSSFYVQGPVSLRGQLNEVALKIIPRFWSTGVGPSMFIPAGFYYYPDSIMKTFPEAVHNGFLLFISELGIPSFILAITFLTVLMVSIYRSNLLGSLKLVFWLSQAAIFIVMTMQPFSDMITINSMVWLFLLTQNEKNRAIG